jgi:DnaJ-class molecular chaperone
MRTKKIYNETSGRVETMFKKKCPRCSGFGAVCNDDDACELCNGWGWVWRANSGLTLAPYVRADKQRYY